MKSAVIVFPGSNCDSDMYFALEQLGFQPEYVWHKSGDLSGFQFVTLPGGFSYGDYLRSGAIARFSPIMSEVVRLARRGNPVLGVCNGFQILVEAHLLPGALVRNRNLRFVCRPVYLRTRNRVSMFTRAVPAERPLQIPIAHGEGRYVADPGQLDQLREYGQIAFSYVNADNEPAPEANPNGSLENIAGVLNRRGNVLGMMPHPERAVETLLGSADGRPIFQSLLA